MARGEQIPITDDLRIDEGELDWIASRSAGPGGQNVNKVETRMTLCFDVAGSPSLTPEMRQRILEGLATRINKAGVLRVSSQRHRTQVANRDAARERFAQLLREVLTPEAPRRPTRRPRRARERRLADKRHRAELKVTRGRPPAD